MQGIDESFIVEVAIRILNNTWRNIRIEVFAANESEALRIAEQDIFEYADDMLVRIVEAHALYIITDL